MSEIKILLWSPLGAGLHYYGPGTNAYNLYKYIRREADIELSLIHSNPDQTGNEIYEQVVCLGAYPLFTLKNALPYLYKSFVALWKFRGKGYIFHGLDTYTAIFLPALFARSLGFRVALKVASYPSGLSASRYRLVSLFRRFASRFIDQFFVISEEIREELLDLGISSSQLAMVYNGVDVDRFANCGTLSARDRAPLRLLFTGAVCRRKRPHMILEALNTSGVFGRWRVDFVGPLQDKAYLGEMQAFLSEIGMEERVVFHGYQRDVVEFYRRADLYALPSSGEGMPNGVLEAMASGVPVAMSPFSSASLLCDGQNGAVLEDMSEYVGFIQKVTGNPELLVEMGAKSRQLVERRFSMTAVARSYVRSFEQMSLNNH